VTPARVIGVVVGVIGLAVPTYLAVTFDSVRSAGVAGYFALFFGVVGFIAGVLALALHRKDPRGLLLPVVSSASGALALVVAGLGAWAMRSVDPAALPDVDAAMQAYVAGEAQGAARTVALLGLAGLPAFAIGFLSLAWVLGSRRLVQDEAKKKGETPPSIPAVWAAVTGVSVLFLPGLGLSVVGAFSSVDRVAHPHEARLVETAAAANRGELKVACAGLEEALAPDFVPTSMLDEHLPKADREELAHRCVTHHIDALPAGAACAQPSGALAATRTVALVGAAERVKNACLRTVTP
jgi:hypothetical protein